MNLPNAPKNVYNPHLPLVSVLTTATVAPYFSVCFISVLEKRIIIRKKIRLPGIKI